MFEPEIEMETLLVSALIALQLFVVAFIALHDWVPLGRLNNLAAVQAADRPGKLFIVTLLSTLPFAVGFAASVFYAGTGFPEWLMWWLWISYGAAVYGMLHAGGCRICLWPRRRGRRAIRQGSRARTPFCRYAMESGRTRCIVRCILQFLLY